MSLYKRNLPLTQRASRDVLERRHKVNLFRNGMSRAAIIPDAKLVAIASTVYFLELLAQPSVSFSRSAWFDEKLSYCFCIGIDRFKCDHSPIDSLLQILDLWTMQCFVNCHKWCSRGEAIDDDESH